MRRTVSTAVVGIVAALGLAVFALSCGDSTAAGPPLFTANLVGSGEPTPTGSTATGTATFSDNTSSIDYVLTVSPMTAISASHIHVGPPGCVCPVIINLFIPNGNTGTVSGVIATGTITAANNSKVSLDSLRVLFNNGNAYVNVHTFAFSGGEIRGVVTRTN
ncbi:MAG: CHRD domain-containing protein [Gemmatimonadota bacterium]|nr:CHRD domain-containing protein [Gemmatimonadota bacterium]